MNDRILVTYASRAGSTAEVALAIGGELRTRGFAADVEPIKEKPKLVGYGAVLIGSAVRMGNWLPEAVEFVKANRRALSRVPVALFTVHLLNYGDDEQSRQNREAYLSRVRPYVCPVDEVFFAGRYDPARLSLIDRLTSQAVGAPVGDFRDWDKIRRWAHTYFGRTEPAAPVRLSSRK